MMRLGVVACVCILAAAEVSFDAVVDEQGSSFTFVHADGADVSAEASAFCVLHVNATLQAQCIQALVRQVAMVEAQRDAAVEAQRDVAAVSLQIQIGEGGTVATFEHVAGASISAEATAFCAEHVPADQVSTCAGRIVNAAVSKAAQAVAEAATADAPVWEKLLGPTLLDAHGAPVAVASALEGKRAVALLFAADWCGPCRKFSPKLLKYYELATRRPRRLEIIWVSGSRDQRAYDAYRAEMSWPSVPFDPRRTQALQQAFGVGSFPTLVFLDTDANVITKTGVEQVSADPHAIGLPYRSPVQNLARAMRALKGAVLALHAALRPRAKPAP